MSHTLLIVGPHTQSMAALLAKAALPGLRVSTDGNNAEARASAEIILGPPDAVSELLGECPSLVWVQST